MTGKSSPSSPSIPMTRQQKRRGFSVLVGMSLLMGMTGLGGCKGSRSEKPPVHVWQQMDNQQYYRAQTPNTIFSDGRSMRAPVKGTVARGGLKDNFEFYRGRDTTGRLIDQLPAGLELSKAFIKHGETRYNIYCAPCHDGAGRGKGMIQQHAGGFKVAPKSFQSPVMRAMPLGHFFHVTTEGSGTMRPYASQVPELDRWAIAAWIRVLQTHGADKGWND